MVRPWFAKTIGSAGSREPELALTPGRLRCKWRRSLSSERVFRGCTLFDGAGESFFHSPEDFQACARTERVANRHFMEIQLDPAQTSFRS
jgi:hypothetical protein